MRSIALILLLSLSQSLQVFAQSVGDFSIPYKANATGPATEKHFAGGVSKLWGTTDAGAPVSITLGTGLSLSSNTLTISGVPWSVLTSTPTTLSGYGITNGLVTSNNLSDLTSAATARSNLGLGAAALLGTSTTGSAGAVAVYGLFGSLSAVGSITASAAIGSNTGAITGNGFTFFDGTYSLTVGRASLTANRQIDFPNVAGTLITTGDTGTVTNTMLAGSIALSKLSITGTPNGTKYLRDDGTWQTLNADAVGLGSGDDVTFGSVAAAAATIGEINTGVLRITDGAFTGSILASLTASRNWAVPDHDGDFVLTGDTATVTNTMLAGSIANNKLANSSITINGSAVSLGGSTTISTGLTIGTTTTSGASSGDILTSNGTVLQKITPGTGVSAALGNATDAASGLLTYGIIGTSGTKLPLLNAANSFSALQTVTGAANTQALQVSGTITGGSQTRSLLKVSDDWTGATGGTSAPTVIEATITDVGGLNYGATNFLNFKRNGSSVLRIDHGGTFYGPGNAWYIDTNNQKIQLGSAWGYTISGDVWLYRDAAAVWAMKNSTTAQTLRIYGTTTGSKYLSLAHDGTNAIVSASSGEVKVTTGGLTVGTSGSNIASIKRSSVTLVAGTATVSDTATTANTVVLMSVLTPGGTVGTLDYDVSVGSSYTINSSSATDTSTINITVLHFP